MPLDQTDTLAARWADRTRAVAAAIAAVHAPTEEAFLAVGARLGEAHGAAQTLTAMASALASRLDEPEFRDTMGGLAESVGLVDALRRRAAPDDGALGGMADAAQDIAAVLKALAETMARINALGLNARIEAARMTTEGIDFTVFTHGIVHLAERGRAAVDTATAELGRLQGAVGRAAAAQHDFAGSHLSDLTVVGERLGASVAGLRQREAEAGRALEALPGRMAELHGRIGQLVADLQIHDMTRQRLEHVEHALEALAEACAADGAEDGALPRDRLGVFVNAVCDLQCRQLEAIEGEFTARTQASADNLAAVGRLLDGLRRDMEHLHAGDAEDGSSFLLDVDADIARVSRVVQGYGAAARATADSLAEAGRAAEAMATAMAALGEIDADLNVLGLNASIKCGNLRGQGRTLNVIAQELRAFARETRGRTATVAGRLAEVTAVAGRLHGGGGDDALDGLRQSLEHTVARLRQAGGETAWVLADMRQRSDAVARAIDEALQRFTARHGHGEQVRRAIAELRDCAATSDPGLPPEQLQVARSELLRFMEGRYTMASERDIHAALTGEAPPLTEAAEADIDDMLF